MAPTHTTGPGGILLCQPITGEEAATHHAALDRVLGHLKAAGINAQLIQRRADRCAITIAVTREPLWHPPELIIYANAGWRIATVTIGPRSGSYAVELARVEADNVPLADRIELVPASQPQRVGLLVAQNAGASA
ncbi:hypothetical protein [Nonomuraea sp. JJY05]|jgi:hypothetical protein|uniref:hypothetical protein n=1 Tax=Nonomuraea sp. JJY05 TaxID=3350255 RepID=UPI00373F377A